MQTPAWLLDAAASSATATSCCPLQNQHMHACRFGRFAKLWHFPRFYCVTCLSPQTKEGCFLSNSSVAVAAKTLGAAGGRTLSQRFCLLFQLFHKRFYSNLPAFLSQMCNTIGFIPFISLSSVLWSGRESACAEHASCGLWKPPTHLQRTSLPRFQLGRSKRWFSELAQPGCLHFRLRRSMWAGH